MVPGERLHGAISRINGNGRGVGPRLSLIHLVTGVLLVRGLFPHVVSSIAHMAVTCLTE